MKTAMQRASLALFAFIASITQVMAQEGGAASEPSPTVDTFWVFVFLVLFVGVCVWIGIAIWRAEHKKNNA